MSKYVTLEPVVKTRPPMLILDFTSGARNTSIELVSKFFESKTKTYILTKKKAPAESQTVSSLSVHFLDRLNGSLPYALLFIDDVSQKKQISLALKKLSSQNTKIILLVPRRRTALFLDILLDAKSLQHTYTVLTGDFFGLKFQATALSKIIRESFLDLTISVSPQAIVPIFPISDTDFLNLISYMLFGNPKEHGLYKGYYGNPQTLLSLAHILQRHEPELSLDFSHSMHKKNNNGVQLLSDRAIKDRLGLAPENVQGIFQGFTKCILALQDEFGLSQAKYKKRKMPLRPKINGVGRRVFVLFLSGFLLYVAATVLLFLASVFLFKDGTNKLLDGKHDSARETYALSKSLYDMTQKNIYVFLSLPGPAAVGNLKIYMDAYADLQVNTLPTIEVLTKITRDKKISEESVSLLESFARNFYFFIQKQNSESIVLVENSDVDSLSKFVPLMQTIKNLGGYGDEKSYLVLLQNSNELRPTGGFIGSVAYITVKDGSITSNQVQDVYDLDGQLKGHVEPHYIIRRNLQPNLYLRDSNFNPDFDISASTSALLYTLESGKPVNGVIAIDTHVLKKLLQIAGPLKIPGQSKLLTPENAASLIQDSIQSDFFPGSIEKKQTLNALMSKILVTIESDPKKQIALLKTLPLLLSEKHIMFSFPNQSIQKAFVASGFAGSMSDTRIQKKNILDFLSVNEANIGVNKVNEFVTRSVTYAAYLHPDELLSDALLTVKNDGEDDYRAYVRFIVPQTAVLSGITINGASQSLTPAVVDPAIFERAVFKTPSGLEVDQFVQNDKRMIGFIVNTAKKTQTRIHVLYKTPYKGLTAGTFDYSLLYVKQPGTESYPLTVQLETDDRFKTVKAKDGSVLINETVATDMELTKEVQRIKE